MTISLSKAAVLALAASFLLVGSAQSQDKPAPAASSAPAAKPSTQKPAASSAPAAKPSTQKPAASGTAAAKPRTGTAARTAPALPLKTQKEKASYAIGLNIGRSMRKDEVDIDPTVLARGMRDALSGAKPALTDEEMKAALMGFQGQLQAKAQAKMAALAAVNKKEGDAFLASNKAKDGVVTLPSGLEYKVLKAGTGPKPKADDTVVCHYKGTFVNDTEFDSSYKRGEPATFPVSGVIKGWTEALQLMPVGSKWQLVIPPDLAYGPEGRGAEMPPNSTLVFEVELLSIEPKKPEANAETPAAPPTTAPSDPTAAPKPQQ